MCNFLRGEVVCNPALSFNIGATSGSDAPSVSIIPSSFGPLPPPLPTARSITVAQIISPPAPSNPPGPSLLRGLREYFQAYLRLVKRGDVLVIPIETDPLSIHITTTLRDISDVSSGNL